MTEQDFLNALQEAYRRAGTQQRLASQIGISQSTIAGYFSGRYSVGNMTVSTLVKLFPNMVIDFFGGRSANLNNDLLREQLLEIFDSLDDRSKVRMVAMAAAKFGEKLKEEAAE